MSSFQAFLLSVLILRYRVLFKLLLSSIILCYWMFSNFIIQYICASILSMFLKFHIDYFHTSSLSILTFHNEVHGCEHYLTLLISNFVLLIGWDNHRLEKESHSDHHLHCHHQFKANWAPDGLALLFQTGSHGHAINPFSRRSYISARQG